MVPTVAPVTGLLTVKAGQQRGPGRAAYGVVVKTGEAQTARCQRVDVGRIDFTAVATEVGPTHVVDHDQEDVGAFVGMQQSGEEEQRQA